MITIKNILILLFAIFIVGCSSQSEKSTATIEPTLTPEPTPIPTKPALGSENNPILIGVVPLGNTPGLDEILEQFLIFMEQGTGQHISINIYPNYTVLINQMRNSNLHIAFLQPLTYLYAHENEFANAVMLLSHYGLYDYGTQFFIHESSGFFPYFDPKTQRNLGGAETALEQLQGTRPCWTSPMSISGFLLPKGILEKNKIALQAEVFTQSYNASLRALYISGICDFGATYAHSGDPRTSESLQSELPDVIDRVVILWQSEPLIPYLNISFHPTLSADIQQKLITSLLVLIQTQEGKEQLSKLNNFQIDGGKIIDDSYYDLLREFLGNLGEKPQNFFGY